jgi:hypothetical protein
MKDYCFQYKCRQCGEIDDSLSRRSPNDTTPIMPELKIAQSEPMHVYEWLDLPASNEGEKLAKEWLNKFSMPAYDKYTSGANSWLRSHALTVEWRGQRYYCRGCSRMGDVWITKDHTGNSFYDHRVNVEELTNWKRFDNGAGNLTDV